MVFSKFYRKGEEINDKHHGNCKCNLCSELTILRTRLEAKDKLLREAGEMLIVCTSLINAVPTVAAGKYRSKIQSFLAKSGVVKIMEGK